MLGILPWLKSFNMTISLVSGLSKKKISVGPTPRKRLCDGASALFDLIQRPESLRNQVGLQPPLCQFLTEIWATRATDPRDLVFGLVNLTRDAGSPDFAPNYGDERDLVEFYTEICRRFLRRGELKSVLYVAGVGYPRTLNALPSWVPDWTCTPEMAPLKFRNYNASAHTESHIELSLPGEISIGGIRFDTISATTSRCFPATWSDPKDRLGGKFISFCATLLEALRMIEPLPQRYLSESINQSKTDAFWRTMVGDAMQVQLDHGQEQNLLSHGASTPMHLLRFNRPIPNEYGAILETWGPFLSSPQIEALVAYRTLPNMPPSQPSFEEVFSRNKDLQELYEAVTSSAKDILSCAGGRKFAITAKGYMAVVPPLADVGDEISVLCGLEVLFVLRTDFCHRGGSGKVYNLVGEAYLHGIMDGEALCDEPVEREERFRVV
ncbi:hypothetical protein FOXG_14303 [Fusarium oxysporum f. sp. lycopersici 4287]|uniref:Heterokaryon incompatibility domain-containing protein n=1 Tax=Fusarium oxysporum f. sp. lycopersici (strain 4287 / CBS 123668 / FGSC 9935 / NRRL 34936) TaxID=426428 RepID=A0A0J9W0U7_FUSO4|nr:hypothetical protein FOXG_14303 [Fusarium oxysporum f. sp. lycopersici 4287]KNB16440.1 hypothetical protein FOXG_14303 [Fusarium oxysporum f. sp. lycopersici 4287]